MKVAVTAATGQLGRKAVDQLLARGADVIAAVRTPAKAADLAESGVDVRHGDYDRPESLPAAFAGAEVLLLIPSTAPVEHRVQQHHAALAAAKQAGVGRVVLVSFMAAEPDSRFQIAPFMLYAESKLRLSGLEWTICRDGMYLDPVVDWIPELVRMGRLPYPVAADSRVAYVGRDDLARALAAACTEPGHAGQLYRLTGAEALTMPELATIFAAHARSPIAFDSVSEPEFIEICGAGGESEELTEVLVSMYRAVDNSEFAGLTDHIQRLTGAAPRTVTEHLNQLGARS